MSKQAEAIGWARVSSPKQWNDGDHKIQENKIDVWCGDNNIRCIKTTSAQYRKSENPFDNPEMRYLLYDIDTCAEMGIQPDMVVAVKLDRFGNEDIILNVLLPFFHDRNIAMVTTKEGVNSMTDREAFIRAVREDNATARDAKRTEATQQDRVYKLHCRKQLYGIGFPKPIFGLEYICDKKEYVEKKTCVIVTEIFLQYVYVHKTLSEICAWFDTTKFKPLRSKRWTEKKVANILRNPAYSIGSTKVGIKCPSCIPHCTADRAIRRLDMEKGGRKASADEPLRKIAVCGYCGAVMRLRTKNGVRKYVCKNCQWEQEESFIMDKAIEQTKVVLKGMLNESVMQIDMSNILQNRNDFISRVDILFCEFDKVETGDMQELIIWAV
jgi:DNA invertase Pin-like site-specific DNA recombinase